MTDGFRGQYAYVRTYADILNYHTSYVICH